MNPQAESAAKMLAKAAADANGIVERMTASMEKEAGPWDLMRRGGQAFMKTFTRPANPMAGLPKPRPTSVPTPTPRPAPAPKPVKPPLPPMGPREFSPARLAGTLGTAAGAAGAGTIGYGHMQNAAENTVGRSINPLTWFDPQSEDQVFDRNRLKAQGMFDSHAKAQQEAIARGDFDAAGTMADQMQSGDFGRSGWLQRTFNPFTSQESGKTYADRARAFQAGDPAKIEKMQANLKRFGPQMSEQQRASMQQQIEALNKHKDMQIPFGAPKAPADSGDPMSAWLAQQRRPAGGNPLAGAVQPYDYRRHMYEAGIQSGGQAGF